MAEEGQPESSPSIRAGYDRWSVIYDHDANPLPALEEPLVRQAITGCQFRGALPAG